MKTWQEKTNKQRGKAGRKQTNKLKYEGKKQSNKGMKKTNKQATKARLKEHQPNKQNQKGRKQQ